MSAIMIEDLSHTYYDVQRLVFPRTEFFSGHSIATNAEQHGLISVYKEFRFHQIMFMPITWLPPDQMFPLINSGTLRLQIVNKICGEWSLTEVFFGYPCSIKRHRLGQAGFKIPIPIHIHQYENLLFTVTWSRKPQTKRHLVGKLALTGIVRRPT